MLRLLPVLALGCASEGDVASRDVDAFQPGAWRFADPENDPVDGRPERVRCDGWWPEEDVLLVDTAWCDWLTVHQAARVDLPAGAVLRTQLEHGELTAPERSDGFASLWLGGVLLEELKIRIPGPSREYPIELVLDRSFPAGTALTFHVHNHGGNVWALRPVEVAW